jgi:hypothetical protein
MLPTLRTDPTEPMLRNEFLEPMDSIELREAMLHLDPCSGALVIGPW